MENEWTEYEKTAKAKGFTLIACVPILGWWPVSVETMRNHTHIATYLGSFV